uniref:HAUS augmin like complex subunit 2 n=1 Tax=Buteo japonicus TaxID=224669 RepID=A0A8C0HLN6_9AVES
MLSCKCSLSFTHTLSPILPFSPFLLPPHPKRKKLKTEILQLEKETADIAHPFYLGKKCEILQDMNRHLEAILKEKRALRKRLIKPRCQESLPIEATFHKYVVELLTEAVTFIEKLESHLQAVRSIPQIPNIMKNMDTALTKTEVLVMELEELAEQILKWREQQKVYSDSICIYYGYDVVLWESKEWTW